MELDSPEEKEFPGLYASEAADSKSKKSKEESDYSEGDHDKLSKKDLLIGRRKDKKEKGKDRGYAALEGESSPEEELDSKSPSKSKKSKTFKFTTSKSKEKREKSRDKYKECKDDEKEKERHEKEQKRKDKDKDKKEKKEKAKDKDKDKKDKKTKHVHSGADSATEEVLTLGYPVFGVSVSLATERSRCHDGIELPLVVRDCIDYLQEHALKCEHIYKIEPIKTRLQHYKRLYNNRERQPGIDELDMPTACSLLKLFLKELPEPVLTTDLVARFEEVASHPEVTKQQAELQQLLEQLPKCNQTLLSWVLLHFDSVIQYERYNKLNAQSLAMLLSPTLQMSHRLLVALLCHCTNLFPDVKLIKYVPPLTSTSPKLPDNVNDIQNELCKQESLLTQIHCEMNAGFITKKREEQLWEVQRIITQLKRKLRSFEKKQDKSVEELEVPASTTQVQVTQDTTNSQPVTNKKTNKAIASDDEISIKTLNESSVATTSINSETKNTPQQQEANEQIPITIGKEQIIGENIDGFYIDEETGLLMVPKTNPDWSNLLRAQLEFKELMEWKVQLQARINAERSETLRLKQQLAKQTQLETTVSTVTTSAAITVEENTITPIEPSDYEKIIENYARENKLLEHKKQMLAKELFEERCECIALQVELALQQF